MNSDKDSNKEIDNCLRRLRNARNAGADKLSIIETLSKDFEMNIIFLCWHFACLMDGH